MGRDTNGIMIGIRNRCGVCYMPGVQDSRLVFRCFRQCPVSSQKEEEGDGNGNGEKLQHKDSSLRRKSVH